MTDAKVKTLRPAVERVIERSRKLGDEVPAAVRRVLRFKRLPAPALAQVIKAVEDNDGFRDAVSAGVKESDVGRGGYLWLARPAGWAAEFDSILGAEQRHADALREIQLEREGIKSVESLRETLGAAQARIAELETERLDLAQQLDRERAERQRVQGDLTTAEAKANELSSQRQEAVRQMKKVEQVLLRRNSEREALLARLAEANTGRPPDPARLTAVADSMQGAHSSLDRVNDAVAPLQKSLEPLQEALDDLRAQLARVRLDIEEATTKDEPTEKSAAEVAVEVRTPVDLPPATRDDGAEAAEFLAALPNATMLVDGYNASMNKWPNDPIQDQRTRLVAGLDRLAARTSLDIDVVFDGADDGGFTTGSRYLGVRVRFSPPDVEADDVIIETAASLPADRSVLVVSDDERVRAGGRRAGANILTVHQLFGLMR